MRSPSLLAPAAIALSGRASREPLALGRLAQRLHPGMSRSLSPSYSAVSVVQVPAYGPNSARRSSRAGGRPYSETFPFASVRASAAPRELADSSDPAFQPPHQR